jgi:hypothetical protein
VIASRQTLFFIRTYNLFQHTTYSECSADTTSASCSVTPTLLSTPLSSHPSHERRKRHSIDLRSPENTCSAAACLIGLWCVRFASGNHLDDHFTSQQFIQDMSRFDLSNSILHLLLRTCALESSREDRVVAISGEGHGRPLFLPPLRQITSLARTVDQIYLSMIQRAYAMQAMSR